MEQCVRDFILKLLPRVLKLEEPFNWDRLQRCLAQTLSPQLLDQHKDEIYELIKQYSTQERLHSAIDIARSESSYSTTMSLFAPHTILSSPPRQDPSSIMTNDRTWTKVRPSSKGFLAIGEPSSLEERRKGSCFVFTAEDDNYISDQMLSRCQLHPRVKDGRISLCFVLESNKHRVYRSTFCVATVGKSSGFDVLLGNNWNIHDTETEGKKDDTVRIAKRRRTDVQIPESQSSPSESIAPQGVLDSPEAIGVCIGSAIRAYNSSAPRRNQPYFHEANPSPTIYRCERFEDPADRNFSKGVTCRDDTAVKNPCLSENTHPGVDSCGMQSSTDDSQ